MAFAQEICEAEECRCYHCGSESSESSFKYFDNKKEDQPRYQCHHCHKLFTRTLGSHGRSRGKTYAKKLNEDPAELKSLSRQCCHCGVADHAVFKYYNNKNLSQPRFKCLSCGKQFQMRLMGSGEERRLVHASSQQTIARAPRCQKQGVPEPFPSASSSSEDEFYQPFDGSFMPVPYDPLMPLEHGARLLPEMSDEDLEYSDFLETQLDEEENMEVVPPCWTTNAGDNGNLLPPWSDESLPFGEAELLTEENNEAPNVDAFSSTANVGGEWPPTCSSNDDAEPMNFTKVSEVDMGFDYMPEMVSESTSNNVEAMYGTLVANEPASSDSDSWSQNDTLVDPSNMSYMSYMDAAVACCHQLDLNLAREKSMPAEAAASAQSVGSECFSSSSVGSTLVFADPFRVIPESLLVQQALTEDEQCSDFHWSGDDESEDDREMSY